MQLSNSSLGQVGGVELRVLIVPSSCAEKEVEKEQRVSLCLLSVDSREAVCGLVSRPVLFPGLRQGSKATGNMVQHGSRTSTSALVAAQITDTNMASGGSTDHGHQHNLWCQRGPPSLSGRLSPENEQFFILDISMGCRWHWTS